MNKSLYLASLLLAGVAHATTPTPTPAPNPTVEQDQQQGQDQGQDQDQDQQQAQLQKQQQGQDVQNEYRSKSSAIALSLPGLVAAPAATGTCLVHSRGWGAFSIGATGGTSLDKDCVKVNNCMAMADRFAAWGQLPAAMAQLQACGAVPATFVPPVVDAPAPPTPGVTKDELDAVARQANDRMDRLFKQGVSK